MTDFENNPELAFAIYASTAATLAVVKLKEAGLVSDDELAALVENLTICRRAAGQTPRLVEHAELLTDILHLPRKAP